jgi:hypothetical protein
MALSDSGMPWLAQRSHLRYVAREVYPHLRPAG